MKAKFGVDVVLACDALPIGEDLRTLCILFTPLGVGAEGRLVDVRWYVAPYSRVAIFEPADTSVLT